MLRLDVAMTARILVLTNSAYFRKGVVVTTVERCLTILGINLFRMLAASTFVFKVLGDRAAVAQEFSFRHFEAHSNLVARTTKRMLINPFLVQEAYTVGLLHDIGSLIVATCLPDIYDEIATDVRLHGMPHREAEIDHLGTRASSLGGYVMTLWGMPEEIVDIIQAHDTPITSLRGVGSELRPTLQLASQLLAAAQNAESARMPPENPFGWLDELDATGASRSPNMLLTIAQEEWQASADNG